MLIIQALSDPQSLIVKAQRLDRLSLNSSGEKKMRDDYKLSEFFLREELGLKQPDSLKTFK